MSRPSKMILPAVGSRSRVSSRPVVVLPQPDSPTSESVSPALDREVDPVDGLDGADLALQQAPADREVLDQPVDLEQVRRRRPPVPPGAVGGCHRVVVLRSVSVGVLPGARAQSSG